MPKKSLGEFEQIVLLALLGLGNEAYVVPIIAAIEERTGKKHSHAAVYVALTRLEDKGLVTSRLADATPERGGRAKRYFTAQPEGIRLLYEARDALLAMWDGVEAAR